MNPLNQTLQRQRAALLALALTSVLLAGCVVPPQGGDSGSSKSGTAATVPMAVPATALQGGDWTVTSIEGVERITAPAPKIRFAGTDYVGGNAGCNNFVGKYQLTESNGALTLGPLASTRMMCVPKPQGQEDMFFKATELTRTLRLQGAVMLLLNAQQQVVMRLERATP